MNCYYSDLNGDLVELGNFTQEQAIALLRMHGESNATKALYIGASRNDTDFVEIGYEGDGRFMVHTDRLVKPAGFWKKFFAKHHIDIQVSGLPHAEDVLISYFNDSRECFENRLSES